MLRWFTRLFREVDRFDMARRGRSLPTCHVRAFGAADFDACAEIYRLNEAEHFPAGYFDYFCEWLRSGRDLILVCEVAEEIRGFGGISMIQRTHFEIASLNFGMVHPGHHKQGFGTVLLLARLATLPPPDCQWVAFLCTTGGSETFYKRFSFVQSGRFADDRGVEFDRYRSRIYRKDWQACRDALAADGIVLDTEGLIVPPIVNMQNPLA